jgi:spore germination protein Q
MRKDDIMNGSYFQPPIYPGSPMMPGPPGQQIGSPLMSGTPNQQMAPTTGVPIIGTAELSYVENILRANRGKLAKVFMSFPDSVDWRDRVFTGIIETSGRDHTILSDPKTGMWYILLNIYLNYIEFQEKINYPLEAQQIR